MPVDGVDRTRRAPAPEKTLRASLVNTLNKPDHGDDSGGTLVPGRPLFSMIDRNDSGGQGVAPVSPAPGGRHGAIPESATRYTPASDLLCEATGFGGATLGEEPHATTRFE